MATVSFEGETHDEIVRKMRRYLAALDGDGGHIGLPSAVERASDLTKEALTIIAQAAPTPVARTDVFQALQRRGYEATDSMKRGVVSGLDAVSKATDGTMVERVQQARNAVLYKMTASAARQLLKSLDPL